MSRAMNNLKDSFTIMKAKTTILKMKILPVCHAIHICLKKPYNKPLNDRLVITRKYQTSVFYVQTSPYGLGPYCQNLGLVFSHNDRTLG